MGLRADVSVHVNLGKHKTRIFSTTHSHYDSWLPSYKLDWPTDYMKKKIIKSRYQIKHLGNIHHNKKYHNQYLFLKRKILSVLLIKNYKIIITFILVIKR